MTLLTLLVKCPENNKPLICFIISAILKQRSPKLGLVQRAISILHYFHVYCVLDHVHYSGLSDVPPTHSSVDPLNLIPSNDDIRLLKEEMSTIISQ